MELQEAYETLKQYFSREFIEGRTTENILLSAENSWMMPLPWFFAAAAYARDNKKEGFKKALHAASACYEEIISRRDPKELEAETKMMKEAEAADTLTRNVEQAWELIKK